MKGKVVMVNPRTGLFAVKREDGDFAVCKGTGGLRVEIDDEVSGDLDVVGSVVLDNLTRRALIRVSIQGIYASSRMVLEVLA